MSAQPNIVFIHVESLDGRKLGCMGHAALDGATSNIDRLAAEGVLFRNAYTTCPVCNPSRASLWSGKYPHYRDCWNNHEGLRPGTGTFRDSLRSAGYRTEVLGPLDYEHGKHSIRDRIGSWTRAARIHRPISRTPVPAAVPDGTVYADDWQWTQSAIEQIRTAASGEQPFLVYLTTGLVHPPFVAEERHLRRVHRDAINVPAGLSIEETSHPAERYQRVTKNCANPFPVDLILDIRHHYFAMIAALDEMVGSVLGAIDQLGIADDTYVVFAADHGELAGEHNQILKRSMYEASAHVPLIVRGPDVHTGVVRDTPVSLVDLYPTFLDWAGVQYDGSGQAGFAQRLDGESLMPQLTGADGAGHRGWVMAEYHGDRACTGTFMLRTGEWKLIRHTSFVSQLFDLSADTDELSDLAATRPRQLACLERLLDDQFPCAQIDQRAKAYDQEQFLSWSDRARADGRYESTMAHVYSGFDRQSIEESRPWTDEDESLIERWLALSPSP